MPFTEMLERTRKSRERDAERFENLDWDECMLCGAYGDDKRTLFISCLVALKEVIPEMIDLFLCGPVSNKGYCLRICKNCRGELMEHLQEWRSEMMCRRHLELDRDGHKVDDED